MGDTITTLGKAARGALFILLLFPLFGAFGAEPAELRLPEFLKARAQARLAEIYRKVRLPTDPEKPPEFVIINSEDAAAAAGPKSENKLYFDFKFISSAPSEGILAAVMAHELRHWDQQGNGLNHIVNEADADVTGITKRILRKGTDGPGHYNIDEIIEWFEKRATYTQTHLNGKHAAAALRTIYFAERRKRLYPAQNPKNPFWLERQLFRAAALLSVPRKLINYPINTAAEVWAELVGRPDSPEPETDLKKLGDRAQKIIKRADGRVDGKPTSAELISVRDLLHAMGDRTGHSHGERIQSSGYRAEDAEAAAKALPLDFYLTWKNQLDWLKKKGPDLPPPKDGGMLVQVDELAELSVLFTKLKNWDGVSSLELKLSSGLVTPGGTKEYYLMAPFVRAHLPRLEKQLAQWARQNPEKGLVIVNILAIQLSEWPKPAGLTALTEELIHKVTPERVIAMVQAKELAPAAILALDRANGKGPHRLAARARLEFAKLYFSSEPNVSIALLAFDGESMKAEVARASTSNNPLPFAHYLDRGATGLPDEEVDKLLEGILKRHLEIVKSKSVGREEVIKAFADIIPLVEAHLKTLTPPTFQQRRWLRTAQEIAAGRSNADPALHFAFHPYNRDWFFREVGAVVPTKMVDLIAFNSFDHPQKSFGVILDTVESITAGDRARFPRTSQVCGDIFRASPYLTLAKLADHGGYQQPKLAHLFPWKEVFGEYDFAGLMKVMESVRAGPQNAFLPVWDQLVRRLAELADTEKEITANAALDALLKSQKIYKGFLPGTEKLRRVVERLVHASGSLELQWALLDRLSPAMYSNVAEFQENQRKLLFKVADQVLANTPPAERAGAVRQLAIQARLSGQGLDPWLRQQLMDGFAEHLRAPLSMKELFQIDQTDAIKKWSPVAEHANALLALFDELEPDVRWEFVQWLRGRTAKLPEETKRKVQAELWKGHILIPAEEIETYLRDRFKALSPALRAGFFQIVLSGKGGLVEAGYGKQIRAELVHGLNPEVRRVVEDMVDAAEKALPKSLRPMISAVAFAESGKHSNPEEAMVVLLSSLGPLAQKLGGQNLAFDPNLPPNYRKALEKMWDAVARPSWFEVQGLLTKQYGNLETSGWEMTEILHAGTTEILVLVTDPTGNRRAVAVQRENLMVSAQVDYEDMMRFVQELMKKPGGKARYGWLKPLIEDAYRTMKYEADAAHKPRMTPLMRDAYERAAKKLGAAKDAHGLVLGGWKIATVEYSQTALKDGVLVHQDIAEGVPLRQIKEKFPEVYNEITQMVLRLERETQSPETQGPVDKDRMPGQILVKLSAAGAPIKGTVTLIDFGQARNLNHEALAARDPFIAASLGVNGPEIARLVSALGIKLNWLDRLSLMASLAKTDAPLRPLQAISWLSTHRTPKDNAGQEIFNDLIHAVRAEVRLAHWAESVGDPFIRQDWQARGEAAQYRPGATARACGRWYSALTGKPNPFKR